MDSLIHNMPKIGTLEDKAFGVDRRKGKFHFNFQYEDDIQDVLRNGPYH